MPDCNKSLCILNQMFNQMFNQKLNAYLSINRPLLQTGIKGLSLNSYI